MRLCAVSVDLDEIDCYAAIHGLEVRAEAKHAIYDRAVPRLARLFSDEAIPATFFAIGADLARPENRDAVAALHRDGHEVGNHSLNHRYDLSRCDRATIRAEIAGGIQAIEHATGEAPTGFRAPGYTINDRVFEVLADLGVGYDSSVFPCPAYYAAKTTAIGAIRLRGRRSQSLVDTPAVLSAPADPYRVRRPYYRRGGGTLELPIGVTRRTRLPYIGTSVVLSPPTMSRMLTRMIVGRPLVNLELHGIDLADTARDHLEFLAPHQPDLRRSADDKEASLRAALDTLRAHGYRFVRLGEAAEAFAKA
ncbi:MAG: polysaccharide deacetylase family protein [Myxococcota bacterium]